MNDAERSRQSTGRSLAAREVRTVSCTRTINEQRNKRNRMPTQMSHDQAGTYTQAGLAVGHPTYPRECTLPSYRFHHVAARSCTRAKPELAAAALTHLRHFSKPSLGEKAFETEPPIVFFPLDPKKRHLHWATWWVFGSSENHRVAFPKIRKSATRN